MRRKSAWWQILASLAVLVLVCALAFLAVSTILREQRQADAEKRAVAAAQSAIDSETKALAQVNSLLGQISVLESQANRNGALIGALLADVRALQTQVRGLHGTPVVQTIVVSPSPSPSPATASRSPSPDAAPTSRPAEPPSPSPSASPSPPPTTPARLCIAHICLGAVHDPAAHPHAPPLPPRHRRAPH